MKPSQFHWCQFYYNLYKYKKAKGSLFRPQQFLTELDFVKMFSCAFLNAGSPCIWTLAFCRSQLRSVHFLYSLHNRSISACNLSKLKTLKDRNICQLTVWCNPGFIQLTLLSYTFLRASYLTDPRKITTRAEPSYKNQNKTKTKLVLIGII